MGRASALPEAHPKFAIRSILVRRTKNGHGRIRTRRRIAFAPEVASQKPARTGVFRSPGMKSRWHVDCIIESSVNEDCGPPDC
jgi:hypothetical protein